MVVWALPGCISDMDGLMGDNPRGVLGPRIGDDALGLETLWTVSEMMSTGLSPFAGFPSCADSSISAGVSSCASFLLRAVFLVRARFPLRTGFSSCAGSSAGAEFSSCSATEERVRVSETC